MTLVMMMMMVVVMMVVTSDDGSAEDVSDLCDFPPVHFKASGYKQNTLLLMISLA